jgi:hypothetical protein
MLGVEAAILGVTCLVVVVMLLTAPWWMRGLTALGRMIWRQMVVVDTEVMPGDKQEVIDGEFREVEK